MPIMKELAATFEVRKKYICNLQQSEFLRNHRIRVQSEINV